MLALTRRGSNLDITTRVLDKRNANAVLFEHTVTDTPQADPVLPTAPSEDSSARLTRREIPGPCWGLPPLNGHCRGSTHRTHPIPRAQVIYDNLELWQNESPQLTIQNAVVLSWPVTQGSFILESADNVNGPWTPGLDPWCRTNAGCTEASISAPDSRKFFRLRLGP